ncbi:GyrI-like domain-containing protein [Bacillus horti]|uniref:Transcriptional regulator YdeE n=1 Tax=Caldalkalibacillus horti TaxID=77523 RepID=A0ABT9W5K9_9BACI|nr:GyrI-like domain-containing protein [Bacillus horti]MDQ0168526.1 putative transcriptional regulator YdeE [Bacillus horti]
MKIQKHNERKFVGIHVIADSIEEYPPKIKVAVSELEKRISKINHVIDANMFYGLHKVNGQDDEDGYWNGVEIESFAETPAGMDEIVVPAAEYATIFHEGTPEAIHSSYEKLYHEINASDFQADPNAWTVEEYVHNRQEKDLIRTTLYIPIKSKD